MVNIIIDFLKNAERKRHTEEITFDKLIMMSENIASGMSELVRLGIVHRDLAARNVMVDKWLQVSTNQQFDEILLYEKLFHTFPNLKNSIYI